MIDYAQDPEGAIREHFQIESEKRSIRQASSPEISISAGAGITVEKSGTEISISTTQNSTVKSSESSSLAQLKEMLSRLAVSWQRDAAISTSSDAANALRRCASQLNSAIA